MVKINSPKDFWAGLMFFGIGAFFAAWALYHYQLGNALRMGPAYFPAVLGGLLALLGIVVLAGSFVFVGPSLPPMHLRPIVLLFLATIAYGYLMKPLGLFLATFATVFIAALAGHEFRLKEVLILGVLLALFSYLVFAKGLTLPFPLCPQTVENCPIR